jgi:hypothetical protein
MYPNPNRADQVLVYVPKRWESLSLQAGIRLALARAADGLTEMLPFMTPQLRSLAQAAQDGFHAKKNEVVENSHSAIVAHLENMAALARCGGAGDRLGDPVLRESGQPRVFGEERYSHVAVADLAEYLGVALGVRCAADLAAADLSVLARRALISFGKLVHAHPENLTLALAGGGAAYVHTLTGWQTVPAAEAAHQQAVAFAKLLVLYLKMPDAALFAPLGRYIAQNLEALAAEESESLSLLTYCARAAEGRALEGPQRQLLGSLKRRTAAGLAPGAFAAVTAAPEPRIPAAALGEPKSENPSARLTDADIDELLAW